MKNNSRKAKCIAIFGTGSDVGKSVIATALCRYLVNKGLKVVPFKAQNMSNNSGVTPEGLEMGRAQIVQAEAACVSPHVDMNPILLKPTGDKGSQVVFKGKVLKDYTAKEYHVKKEMLFEKTVEALDKLRENYDVVVIEGAGSCAEVNLMPHDIVNFRIAEYCDADVILAGDIHRGGIFAQLKGTVDCISKAQQDMIKGFIINRFRGDVDLFKDGIDWIEDKTDKKVFGVLPWYQDIKIESEDSVVIENPDSDKNNDFSKPSIAVIRTPHISNFTDFEPLQSIESINLAYIENICDISKYKAVILPGSKNTRGDLKWLKNSGWADVLKEYSKTGAILGICGGYQLMGTIIHDPDGLEDKPGTSEGLSLLPIETTLKSPKVTTVTDFSLNGSKSSGYEIHMGQTNINGGESFVKIEKRNGSDENGFDGCSLNNGKIAGTYLHGFFDRPSIIKEWFDMVGIESSNLPETGGLPARNLEYDKLSDYFEKHIDISSMIELTDLKEIL
ncbi:MAG: cobyric acid synthase [Deltaproteobacteria bacterium]|nr:cobyric acid synthase [Deltaproteobacteria bacterium]